MLADALLRRQDLDELAELFGHDVPAHADVAVERERLVLGAMKMRRRPELMQLLSDEIDDPVGRRKKTGGLARSLVSGKTFPAPPAST